jgi:hypothetical protein
LERVNGGRARIEENVWYDKPEVSQIDKIMYRMFPENVVHVNSEGQRIGFYSVKVEWSTGEESNWIHPPECPFNLEVYKTEYLFGVNNG